MTANDALKSHLEQAADDLSHAASDLDADAEGLLFLGTWHQSYPAILVRDPFLSDSAKVQFLYLMQESCQRPQGPIAMPSLDQTAQVLNHSKKTVNRDRTLLRVCRWISQHRRVRDDKGRHCGTINAIHSEPCSLHDANRLDTTYLQLLNDSLSHADGYIKRAAEAALASIDQNLAQGEDPLSPADPMARRLNAAKAVHGGGGSFFDLLMPNASRASTEEDAGHTVVSSLAMEKFTTGQTEQTNPMVNFAASRGGHTVTTPQSEGKFTTGQPGVNFATGHSNPMVNFTTGHQSIDFAENNENYPQNAKFTTGYTSSSNYKTTTTNKNEGSARGRARAAESASAGYSVASNSRDSSDAVPVHWPDRLPANEAALIGRAFASRGLTPEQQQDVLDVLARKLQDPENPLRSPVGYAVTLCKRIHSGTFQPVGAPGSSPDEANKPSPERIELNETKQEIRNIQSDLEGLESSLIPWASEEARPALEANRDKLKVQLEQLKAKVHELRAANGKPRCVHG